MIDFNLFDLNGVEAPEAVMKFGRVVYIEAEDLKLGGYLSGRYYAIDEKGRLIYIKYFDNTFTDTEDTKKSQVLISIIDTLPLAQKWEVQ
ncbi:hypothetical protein [Paraliobacillus sp. X-1268]|uniref:hypothetical protein n=1 Tax=Paraliobacillus sp. X-1268 TaxID=2213193 RepID=UPI000E3CA3DE|nr:hypothetical protein [Paraliobacillus sp. X-1268]